MIVARLFVCVFAMTTCAIVNSESSDIQRSIYLENVYSRPGVHTPPNAPYKEKRWIKPLHYHFFGAARRMRASRQDEIKKIEILKKKSKIESLKRKRKDKSKRRNAQQHYASFKNPKARSIKAAFRAKIPAFPRQNEKHLPAAKKDTFGELFEAFQKQRNTNNSLNSNHTINLSLNVAVVHTPTMMPTKNSSKGTVQVTPTTSSTTSAATAKSASKKSSTVSASAQTTPTSSSMTLSLTAQKTLTSSATAQGSATKSSTSSAKAPETPTKSLTSPATAQGTSKKSSTSSATAQVTPSFKKLSSNSLKAAKIVEDKPGVPVIQYNAAHNKKPAALETKDQKHLSGIFITDDLRKGLKEIIQQMKNVLKNGTDYLDNENKHPKANNTNLSHKFINFQKLFNDIMKNKNENPMNGDKPVSGLRNAYLDELIVPPGVKEVSANRDIAGLNIEGTSDNGLNEMKAMDVIKIPNDRNMALTNGIDDKNEVSIFDTANKLSANRVEEGNDVTVMDRIQALNSPIQGLEGYRNIPLGDVPDMNRGITGESLNSLLASQQTGIGMNVAQPMQQRQPSLSDAIANPEMVKVAQKPRMNVLPYAPIQQPSTQQPLFFSRLPTMNLDRVAQVPSFPTIQNRQVIYPSNRSPQLINPFYQSLPVLHLMENYPGALYPSYGLRGVRTMDFQSEDDDNDEDEEDGQGEYKRHDINKHRPNKHKASKHHGKVKHQKRRHSCNY